MEIRTPGGNVPKDPYEDIKTQRVEREKEEKEKFRERERERKKSSGFAFFTWFQTALFFRKLLGFLLSPKEEEKKKSVHSALIHSIEQVKDGFERLKTIDFSQDTQYLSHFSSCWHAFFEEVSHIKRGAPFYASLERFITEVETYPNGQEHSLGYYLDEFAGSEWLPFPFMEMLAVLHKEHISSPETSRLSLWTNALKALISEIQST